MAEEAAAAASFSMWYHPDVAQRSTKNKVTIPSRPSIQLNPAQKQAVEHGDGPLLIIAGAGTGKTRVITQRILWLVEQERAKTGEILALTFTQKAAQEMEERVDVVMPYGYEPMWISTFHSFCDSILRQEAVYIGLDPSYTLMSSAQEYVFFRSKLFELSIDRFRPHGNPTKFIGEILKHFSRLSDEDISPDDYDSFIKKTRKLDADERKDLKELAALFREYSDFKERESVLGFSDLMPLVLRLFREKPKVLKRYQEKFKYVLVDEFQDTNYAQNELVAMLAGKSGNITVVGDDDQSIYKFRGAAISNILDFQRTFPDYTKVVLTRNYRSNQEILDLAYTLIRHNDPYRLEVTEGIDKRLLSVDSPLKPQKDGDDVPDSQLVMLPKSSSGKLPRSGKAIRRIHEVNDVEEAEAVAREIKRLVDDEGLRYADIAILARAHDHANECVQSLRYHGIPFRFLGSRGLYSRPEIKDLVAFLKVLVDYKDDTAMYRLLTLEHAGITPREFVEIQRFARKEKTSMFEGLEKLLNREVGGKPARKEKSGERAPRGGVDITAEKLLSKGSREWAALLLDLLDQAFSQMKDGRTVGTILYDFVDQSGYIKHLTSEESQENEWKVQNISAYFDSLKRFERENLDAGVPQYIEYLDYSMEIGESPQVDQSQIAEFDGVNISTIHGAKGLEFPVVFMVNMVSERFPTRRRSDVLPIPDDLIKEELPEGDEHLQEERRLCYVGMTRAMDVLYLTSADYYAQGIRKKKQSIFLQDVDLIEETKESAGTSPKRDLSRAAVGEVDMDIIIPEDVRSSFLKKLEQNLSYSHISSFEGCPYQFYFRYVLRIPGFPSPSRSFGLTVHNTFREFYGRLMRANKGFEGFEKPPDLEDLLDIYDEKWRGEGYESRAQENRRYVAGKKALTKYYSEFYSGKERPVWLEGRFKVDVGKVRMSGVVDRVDEVKGGFEIIDYKTGKVPKDRRKVQQDLQIPIYVLAAEQLKYVPVIAASYLYVEGGEKISIEVTDRMKEEARISVTGTIDEIRKMKFPPKPGMLCSFCDYRNVCDYAMMK